MTAHRRIILEHVELDKRLGRHVVHDPRSKKFPAETASYLKSVVHQAVGLPFDQGQWGSCTGNALAGALNSAPDYNAKNPPFEERDAFEIYQHETKLEGYTTPPDDPGGSGLMVCRAAKQMGLLRSYRHAFGVDHALRALVLRPTIIGIDWYEGFDHPDSAGLVAISGQVRGGHEVVVDELDVEKQLIGCWNSWGPEWGVGGRFYMSWDTFDALLKHEGDCTTLHV